MGQEDKKVQGPLERGFEQLLWSSRFVVLLPVLFGAFAAICLFVAASYDIFIAITRDLGAHDTTKLAAAFIGAIDFYLIGVVLLIFSFGIYELFISHLDVGRENDEVKILEIENLDDLKNRILKVVIMVLVVTFFKRILDVEFQTPTDMLSFGGAIFLICIGVYFAHKDH